MKMDDVKAIAKSQGIKAGTMKKTELIRAIQASEGNNSCYNTEQSTVCGQEGCLWRDDCK
ncbi:MAG TPA: SAP domain-containing protein [Geobacteraceae bacterium]